jgi:hypothetical protein
MAVILPWENIRRFLHACLRGPWNSSNINYSQQRIIKKHLQLHFGKRLFILDSTFNVIMSSTMSQHITMSIGITEMETRHRSRNDVSTGVMILV